MKVLVDHREHADTLINCLIRDYSIDIERQQLCYGDYHIPPDTVVERKTTYDFCLSIIDGRLFRQAFRLAQLDKNALIIIEGEHFLFEQKVSITINAIRGALISLAQTYRIPVLRTHNEADTAWHISQLCLQRERIGKNRGVLAGIRPRTLSRKKQYILSTLPGIGTKMAKRLLDEFATVSNVINASRQELLRIPGLGAKTVDKIQRVIKEDSEIYGM